jgi:hypothetical protein
LDLSKDGKQTIYVKDSKDKSAAGLYGQLAEALYEPGLKIKLAEGPLNLAQDCEFGIRTLRVSAEIEYEYELDL